MQIGNVTIENGLFLAPMAGATDRSFRRICRQRGAEFTVSEMVSAKALCYEQKSTVFATRSKSAPLACVLARENPMAVQLFGHEPALMAEAARMIEACDYMGCKSEVPPVAIDINMGCPVNKVVANGEGSALMKDIPLAGKIIEAVVGAVKLPVTVKMRAGWDADHINAVELARVAEAAGASALFVHCRTRQQMYAPGVNPEVVRQVKESVRIPVVGNGDIYTPEDALRMMQTTGCDGVMIGRGALGNPWIFAQTAALLRGEQYALPTIEERFDTAMEQIHEMVQHKGMRVGMAEAKKHAAWYVRDVRYAALTRDRIMQAETPEDIRAVYDELMSMQKQAEA
ncbi:MAG: tRNA dihydrouridine synthase DusB [Clostridia bacterium]|nr:tRNA dihydrouridine synthase DusB [Clostridia bacterium]